MKQARQAFYISAVLFILLYNGPVSAHGVTGTVRIDNAVIAEIRYDDGEPFSYSLIKVYSPDNSKIEFQNGRTDARGIFAFVPSKKGTWRVVATDGMAHGKELEVNITDENLTGKSDVWSSAHRQKIISALFFIWAVIATSFYLGARRKEKTTDSRGILP